MEQNNKTILNFKNFQVDITWAKSEIEIGLFKIPIIYSKLLKEYEKIEELKKRFFLAYVGTFFVKRKDLEYDYSEFYYIEDDNFQDEYNDLIANSTSKNFDLIQKITPLIIYKDMGEIEYLNVIKSINSFTGEEFNKEKELNFIHKLEKNSQEIFTNLNWIYNE
jgi:hypothetical protein